MYVSTFVDSVQLMAASNYFVCASLAGFHTALRHRSFDRVISSSVIFQPDTQNMNIFLLPTRDIAIVKKDFRGLASFSSISRGIVFSKYTCMYRDSELMLYFFEIMLYFLARMLYFKSYVNSSRG